MFILQLLRKPEKDDEQDSEKKFKAKKTEKETGREDRSSAGKRQDGDHGEEKTKRYGVFHYRKRLRLLSEYVTT